MPDLVVLVVAMVLAAIVLIVAMILAAIVLIVAMVVATVVVTATAAAAATAALTNVTRPKARGNLRISIGHRLSLLVLRTYAPLPGAC